MDREERTPESGRIEGAGQGVHPKESVLEQNEVDLLGQVCPYPVVNLIREVLNMASGETARFCVDDPLALKSVPEELEEYDDLHVEIRPKDGHWEIEVHRD